MTMTRDYSRFPITPQERKRALQMAIEHFLIADPEIAEALRYIQSDIAFERQREDARINAGEGPSE